MRLELFLGSAGLLLCVGQLALLLRDVAAQLRQLALRAQRIRAAPGNLSLERLAALALDVLVLAEREHVLFHARNLRAQHAQLALAGFLLARQLQHGVVRRGNLALQRLRSVARLVARRRELARAALLLGNRIPKTREHLLRVGDALLRPVAAQHERRAFKRAQLIAQGEISSCRLARLGQRLKLALQLGDDVLHAREIVAHVRQPLLALLLARAVFDNAGRLLKDAASVLTLL